MASIKWPYCYFHTINSCLFVLFTECSRQEQWSGLPFPSPVDHVLSELSTMTRPSWVALHGMAYSFIELNKAVVHVIRLVSCLWLWFSFCLPSDGDGSFLMGDTDCGGKDTLKPFLGKEWCQRINHACLHQMWCVSKLLTMLPPSLTPRW